MKRLITMAVIIAEENDNNKALVYVRGRQKREWLAGIFDSDDSTIEILDANYEDIDFLHNLDVTNIVRHIVENMLKIVRYRMYLKYTTGDHNARKKYIKFKR